MAVGRIALLVVASLFSASTAFAQEFVEWTSKEDLFAANFPGTPVRTEIPWETEYGAKLTARVYTVQNRRGTYSVTAVDYNPVQALLTAKAKACPDQADERCTGHTSFSGAGYWKNDVRGAMLFAASKFLLDPDQNLTHIGWNYLGGQAVEVNEMQLTNIKDRSKTFVTIYMHHSRLYIMRETTPANTPPPGLFVQSMSLKEPDGANANHPTLFFNGPGIEPGETNEFYGRRGGGAGPGAGPGAGAPQGEGQRRQGPGAAPAPAAPGAGR